MSTQHLPITPSANSRYTLTLGQALSNSILLLLILLPILVHYDAVELFNIGSIAINVRFFLLLVVVILTGITAVLNWHGRIPLILLLFAFFTIWGTTIAFFHGLPIRWWLPPFLRWTANIFIAFAAYSLVLKGHLTPIQFRRAALIALMVPMTVGIVQISFGLAPFINGASRVSSTLAHSHLAFAFFLMTMGLLLLSFRSLNITVKLFILSAFALMLATHSRLTLVALVFSLGWLVWMQRRIRIIIGFIILLIPLLFAASTLRSQLVGRYTYVLTINQSVLQRIPENAYQYSWSERGVDTSVLLRLQTHYIGWEAFKESPWTGYGFGSFVPMYEAATSRPDVAAHNDYLLYLVETGIFGVGFYLALQILLVWMLIRHSKKRSQETRYLTTAVAATYVAVNIFTFLSNAYYFFEIQLWIWMAIGMAIGLIRLDAQKYAHKAQSPYN